MCKSFKLIHRERVIGLYDLTENQRYVRKATGGLSQWKYSGGERYGIEHFERRE